MAANMSVATSTIRRKAMEPLAGQTDENMKALGVMAVSTVWGSTRIRMASSGRAPGERESALGDGRKKGPLTLRKWAN